MRALAIGMAMAFSAGMGFAPAANAQAQDEEECLRLHPEIRSPVEMVACTWDVAGSERRLADAVDRLVRRVEPGRTPLLERAQGAWLAYRDAECSYEAGPVRNTMSSSYVIACTADMNRARAAELDGEPEQ